MYNRSTTFGIIENIFYTILCRDPDYSWNEWDMRKDALRKSNAKNNKTTSMQTEGEPSAQIKTQIGVQGWESSQMWILSFHTL